MTQANLLSEDLSVHCSLFSNTLKGTTLEWYYSLSRNSIDSFHTLSSKFIARFIDNKPMTSNLASFHHVTQDENESRKQYMAHFAKACLNIPSFHPAVAMHALIVGLMPGPFSQRLVC